MSYIKLHTATRQTPLVAVFVALLCACNGGGKAADPPGPAQILPGTINGSVYGTGKIQIYSYQDGKKGEVVPNGYIFVDPLGTFSTTLNVADQPLLVEVNSGSYSEPASGVVVPLQYDITWRAVFNYEAGQTNKLAVNAWTTIATGLAEYKIRMGSPVVLAVDAANSDFSKHLGLDIITTLPRSLLYLTTTEPITPEIEYGYFIAAISQWTENTATADQQPVHSLFYSSAAFARSAYNDIRHDGLLDGKDATGDIYFSILMNNRINQAAYRHELAIDLLRYAQNRFKGGGPKTDELLPAATQLNDSTAAIFGNDPVIALDATGPIISGISPAENAAVYGSAVQISASVMDLIGVSDVAVMVDDNPLETPSDLMNPVLSLDTTSYTDGSHTLKFSATNFVGMSTSVTRNIQIYNKSTMITDVMPVAGTWVGQSMTASATVTDPVGVQSVAFYLGASFRGFAANPLTPSLVMDLNGFGDTPTNLKIVATNLAGNTKTSITTLNFDNTMPVITATSPVNGSYLTASFTASATATDANLTATAFFLDGNPLGDAPDKFNASALIDTTKYSEGTHTVAAVATDKANNKTTKLIPLFFDNTAPVITNMYPANGTVVGNEVFNVGATVTDLAVASVMWYLDGKVHDGSSPLDKPSSFVVGAYLSPGAHTIMVEITDKVGLVSRASTSIVSQCTGPDCGLYR